MTLSGTAVHTRASPSSRQEVEKLERGASKDCKDDLDVVEAKVNSRILQRKDAMEILQQMREAK